ncbi:arca-like protein, partial [Colletotrichum truncatum]
VKPERGTGAAKSEYNFAENQTWVRTWNRSFSFVDETEDVVNIHASGLGPNGEGDGQPYSYHGAPRQTNSPPDYLALLSAPSSPGPDLTSRTSDPTSRAPGLTGRASHGDLYGADRRRARQPRSRRLTNSTTSDALNHSPKVQNHGGASTPSAHTGTSSIVIPWERLDLGTEITEDFPNIYLALEPIEPNFDDALAPHDRTYVETPLWPLRDRQEAFLYRYFVDSLAPLFDLCDSDKHFARVVPKRAVYCPTLLNAMFSASAKRLSRTMGVDAVIADRYHQRCLRSLIPALSSSTAVVDDNLLAAVVILRFTEEVDIGSMTLESHLMGTRILLAAQANAADFSSLRLSAFWLALRQEIYMAFVHTRPVHPNFFPSIRRILERNNADDVAADCFYANKAIGTCAACLSHCYGQENHHGRTYAELKQDLDDWWKEKPWYFEPMWANQESGFLPEEQYITDAAVTGLQHYHLSRMLLIAHNPKVPRLGTAFRAMEEELKQTVRVICGLAVIEDLGGRLMQRRAPYFTNLQAKETCLQDYRRAQLREAWGWEGDSPSPPSMPIAGMLNANARSREAESSRTQS